MSSSSKDTRQSVLGHVPGWDITRLSEARVMVVGAGALGNEVMKNLALLGVREMVIVDFDHVEISNLSRSILFRASDQEKLKAEVAALRVQEINPQIQTQAIVGDILCDVGFGTIREMDLIFGCLDNRLARLWLNRWAFRAGKPWIGGGILNTSGQVVIYEQEGACYECSLTKQGWEDIQHRMGCPDMAQRYFNNGIQPTTPIAASIIAGTMVQEGLKILFGHERDRLKGQMWLYEGQQLHAEVYELTASNPNCLSHFNWPAPQEVSDVSLTSTLGQVFARLESEFGEPVWIDLDHPIALEISTLVSKEVYPFVKPLLHLSKEMAESYRKIPQEGLGVPAGKLASRLDRSFPYQEKTLAELGFPPKHVLRVNCKGNKYYILIR